MLHPSCRAAERNPSWLSSMSRGWPPQSRTLSSSGKCSLWSSGQVKALASMFPDGVVVESLSPGQYWWWLSQQHWQSSMEWSRLGVVQGSAMKACIVESPTSREVLLHCSATLSRSSCQLISSMLNRRTNERTALSVNWGAPSSEVW